MDGSPKGDIINRSSMIFVPACNNDTCHKVILVAIADSFEKRGGRLYIGSLSLLNTIKSGSTLACSRALLPFSLSDVRHKL